MGWAHLSRRREIVQDAKSDRRDPYPIGHAQSLVVDSELEFLQRVLDRIEDTRVDGGHLSVIRPLRQSPG